MTDATVPSKGSVITDTGPLDWRIAITDGNGRPTNEFMRRWNAQRNNNGLITTVTVSAGPPSAPVPNDGNEYIDISTTPPTLYVASSGVWKKVGVYNFTDLLDVPHNYTSAANTLVQVNPGATGLQFTSLSGVLDDLGSATGDLIYRGSGGWVSLPIGMSGNVLEVVGGVPEWSTAPATGVTSISTGTGLTGGPITGTGTISFDTVVDSRILANISGSTAAPVPNTLTAIIDHTIGSTQGDILYRDSGNWAVLAPGTSGNVLTTHGASANPTWSPASASGVTNIATGAGLTGGPITSTGTVSFATIPDGDVLANISGGGAVPSPNTLTAIIDHVMGSTQGYILYRGASSWTVLAPGTSGQLLKTGGASANPSWVTPSSGSELPLVNGDLPGPSIMSDPTTGQTIGVPV